MEVVEVRRYTEVGDIYFNIVIIINAVTHIAMSLMQESSTFAVVII